VASTRAKDNLILCYPGKEELPIWQLAEMGYKSGLSSFIKALPREVMEYASPRTSFEKPGFDFLKRRETIQGGKTAEQVSLFSTKLGKGDESQSAKHAGFRPGDRVKHPAFGRGVISKFIDGNKAEVLFKDVGRKLLHLEHTTLEKM
jgi:DNA helicase II / ATP-dependent DNA helicase PcrA